MENVVLSIHLIIALLLIGVVLLQRNEGGALLSGGGAMTARGTANALTKVTWALATAFIITSITLTALSGRNAKGASVLDTVQTDTTTETPAAAPEPALPEGDLLPPSTSGNGGTTN
ncbi:MAG: preprotein translocase subunit SecG [Paracoccaceae bacterium]